MEPNIKYIDINADLGEGMGYDAELMPLISSCNIACGGHVGDEVSIRATISLAAKHRVKIGAHPSFPDTDSFGRKVLTMTKEALAQSIFHQLLEFYAVCETEGAAIHHIKLHGALYNYAAKDAPTADAVVEAIVATKTRPTLYVPYGSVLHRKAENLLPLRFEAFIDRRYANDLSLVSRDADGAVIHEPEHAWKQLQQLVFSNTVTTVEGVQKSITADTFCIHGDNPTAVEILMYLHQQFENYNLTLQK